MALTGLVAGLAFGITAVCAQAQNGAPETEDARYSFHRVDDGYLRLDVRSGQVSLCSRRAAGWACHPIPDERAALESEIARLQGDNAALKKDMLARGLPLPGTMKPEPPVAKVPEVELKLPSNADIDRMMSVVEKMWRRLVEMIENLQKDMLRKT
jgi:hypothetical protein